jgi:putative tryptophan/tyrosine transport system substrate-binding protein
MKRVGRSSIVVAAVMLTVAMVANAQQPTKVPRIGYLSSDCPSTIAVRIEAFRQGLRELGNVEGKDIVIEWRFAKGKLIGYLALLLNWSASR